MFEISTFTERDESKLAAASEGLSIDRLIRSLRDDDAAVVQETITQLSRLGDAALIRCKEVLDQTEDRNVQLGIVRFLVVAASMDLTPVEVLLSRLFLLGPDCESVTTLVRAFGVALIQIANQCIPGEPDDYAVSLNASSRATRIWLGGGAR